MAAAINNGRKVPSGGSLNPPQVPLLPFDPSQPHVKVTNEALAKEVAFLRASSKWKALPRSGAKLNLLRSISKGSGHGRSFSVTKAAMSELAGTVGGYTVPIDYSLALLDTIAENEFITPRAHVIPMTAAETQCPKLDLESQGALGISPFFGGMQFVWGRGDAGYSLNESEPRFKQVSLKSNDLIGQLVVSNQFVEDLGEEGELALMRLFGKAIAWYKEYAWLNGTGATNAQPLGMLNCPAAIKVSRAVGNQIAVADIMGMADRLLPSGWANAIWACNPKCMTQIGALSQFFINASKDDNMIGSLGNLLGHPLFQTEKLPTLGTLGDLILCDPSLYVIGEREDVIIEASPHPLFTTQQTVFRVWARGDGKPLMDGSAKMADNTTTVSCVVLLN